MNFGPRQLQAGGFQYKGAPKMGLRVHNGTGSSIAADQLVAISGFDVTSGFPKVVLANATTSTTDLAVDVYVTQANIADGTEGYVLKGNVSAANLDTSGVTTVGDPVFLHTVAGAFSATAPTGTGTRVVKVGYAMVKDASVGQVFWHIQPARKFGSSDFQTAVVGGTVDGVTLDTGGAGSTIEIAPLGVTSAQIANALSGLADGLGVLRVCRATFNPSAVSGDRTIAAHVEGTAIPDKSVVVGGFMQIVTALDSADHSGSVAVSINAANDLVTASAINGAPFSTTGQKAIVPKANTPESTGILLTAARQVTFTVTTTALTAGKAIVWLYYVQGAL